MKRTLNNKKERKKHFCVNVLKPALFKTSVYFVTDKQIVASESNWCEDIQLC